MTFEEVFNDLRSRFIDKDVTAIPNVSFQFNVVGDGEGIFYAEVKDGKLSIEPYEYYDNDAIFEAKYDIFRRIINGELSPVNAYLTGRIKVKGDLGKACILEQVLK